jgi:hypothetical protein
MGILYHATAGGANAGLGWQFFIFCIGYAYFGVVRLTNFAAAIYYLE